MNLIRILMSVFLISVLGLSVAGWVDGRGMYFFAGMLLTSVLAAWQYRWIRTRSREGCFRAFRQNNWVGGVVFAGIVADYVMPATRF